MSNFEKALKKSLENLPSEILKNGKAGIEKENLRVRNNNISQRTHPVSIGSSLCNKYITTDFSESQLELITPPYKDSIQTINFLEDTHHFVLKNIKDENLWPMSMPPFIKNEKDISIADYGLSNLGLFKKIYRRGLSHRYGLFMQAISGVHYNYSFSNKIWVVLANTSDPKKIKNLKSKVYFKILRNVLRTNWLILYLFGASPAITKNFLAEHSNDFIRFDDLTFYSKYATSLRMSDIGYQNFKRQKIHVSTDSLDNYIKDLRKATETVCKDFKNISVSGAKQQQINSNIIQTEDEYYAVARVKSENIEYTRFTNKLEENGVDYLEFRSLDLDPFSRIGISRETMLFLEIFMIYCYLKPSEPISLEEEKNIRMNDSSVAYFGRKTGLTLKRQDGEIALKDWANQILLDMELIAEMLDTDNSDYKETIQEMKSKIVNPDLTLSGLIMDKMQNDKVSYLELGEEISKSNKEYYLDLERSKNNNWSVLNKEAKSSLKRQKDIEAHQEGSYEDFLNSYYQG